VFLQKLSQNIVFLKFRFERIDFLAFGVRWAFDSIATSKTPKPLCYFAAVE